MSEENITAEISELLLRRDSLRKRLTSIEEDYKKGLSADSEERAVQLENADVLEGIAAAAAEELQQVEERLAKLKVPPTE